MDDSQPKPNLFERPISRLSGEPDSTEDAVNLLRQAHEQEVFDVDALFRLERILDFAELEVRDAMITRSQMNVIKENDGIDHIVTHIIETSHSRFPVISGDKDEMLGILHAKDLLKFMANPEQFNLQNTLCPAVFVPEGKSFNFLLKELREQRNHMAIITDEYGGASGLVTFEDITEQIIGDIEDEFDEDESANSIHAAPAEHWRINAVTEVEDVNAFFGTDYSDEEVDIIDGLAIQELDRPPVRGGKVVVGLLQFIVACADKRHLHTLMAVRVKEEN